MVPNAWLTRKWCFFGHLNFIITFSVHKLKVCPSHSSLWDVVEVLAIRIAIPWIIGLNQAHAFTKRFIKSSWNMEVTVLQNWGKRWIESHQCFVYFQTYLGLLMSLLLPVSPWQRCHGPCWKSKLIQPHILRKNSQSSTVHHSHTSMLFIGCIAQLFFPWKNELNHCYQKEKSTLYGALTEPVLELE